ncbi:MAG TPA: hypothetical protein VF786_10285 [Terriglobales bacterium]
MAFIRVLCFAIIFTAPLIAQTPSTPASQATAPAKAPDEMTQKITELVHAGRYVEAQQLTTGLLVAYPNDLRLIKAKTLIDQLLASPQTNAESANRAPELKAKANPERLTGMEKVNYDSLIELGREAQRTTDSDQQKELLRQFMEQSDPFLQRHPDEMLLWQLRAAAAISLNDPLAGYEAGQKLLNAAMGDNGDPNVQRLLAKLNLAGWLDKDRATAIAAKYKERSDAEAAAAASVATAAIMTNDRKGMDGFNLKIGDFTAESFTLSNKSGSGTFRFEEMHTFQSTVYKASCTLHVALKGTPPHGIFGWNARDLAILSWDKSHCSDAEAFVSALSTLEKSSPADGSVSSGAAKK